MEIKVRSIVDGRKPSILAHACIEIMLEDESLIVIDNFRIIRNKYGDLMVFAPDYSIANGREYTYYPSVTFSTSLKRRIEDLILQAFESKNWQTDR